MRRQPVSACARTCMLIYTILFWISGFALLFIGLWMLLDPRRSYILDLVDFSEDDPLLKFAAYTAVITGAGTLIIGFFSCCGAIKAERCMLISFIIFIVLILLAEVTIGTLAIVYKQKFTGDRMEVYIANMSQNRYYRDKWVTPLMDAIQYYIVSHAFRNHLKNLIHHDYGIAMNSEHNQHVTRLVDQLQFHMKCCGSESPMDWQMSQWRSSVSMDFLESGDTEGLIHHARPGVPNMKNLKHNKSIALPNVPFSCCAPMTGSTVQNLIVRSVIRCQQSGTASRLWRHQGGCHERLQRWFDEQAVIFAAVGISFAAFQMIGIILAIVMLNQINDYIYLR
uniref:Tetraspanin n=1 Tax=Panagrellus redivivus TaxID=6233 RepID=A0A7E4W3Y3_PANRE